GRARARPDRGDHPLDDAHRAGAAGSDRWLPAETDRAGLGDDRSGREPAHQAVRADAQGDGPARQGQDARPTAADAGPVTWSAAHGRTNQTQKGWGQEEPDLAHRRRRPPLAARRPDDRDDRPLQPPDRPVDDRGRRGARPALDHARCPADANGCGALARQGHRGDGLIAPCVSWSSSSPGRWSRTRTPCRSRRWTKTETSSSRSPWAATTLAG